jgi:hypothetical protein
MSKAICKKHNIENCPQCRFYPENGTGTDKQEENNCYSCSRFADCQTEPEYMFEHCDEWRPESNSDEIREAFDNQYNKEDFNLLEDPEFETQNSFEFFESGYNSALKSQQSLIDEAVELLRDNITEVGYTGYISNRTLQKTEDFLTKIEKDSK